MLGLVAYQTLFGVTLGPVVWLYIPEIVQPNYIGASVMFNWAGATFVIGFFPVII